MSELFEFMGKYFWTTIILALIGASVISYTTYLLLLAFNRFFRHWNIREHGYPPPHCDADGDFKKEKGE